MPTFYAAQILTILGMFSFDLFLFALESTKANFQNYFKYRQIAGKRVSINQLDLYWKEMEETTRK